MADTTLQIILVTIGSLGAASFAAAGVWYTATKKAQTDNKGITATAATQIEITHINAESQFRDDLAARLVATELRVDGLQTHYEEVLEKLHVAREAEIEYKAHIRDNEFQMQKNQTEIDLLSREVGELKDGEKARRQNYEEQITMLQSENHDLKLRVQQLETECGECQKRIQELTKAA